MVLFSYNTIVYYGAFELVGERTHFSLDGKFFDSEFHLYDYISFPEFQKYYYAYNARKLDLKLKKWFEFAKSKKCSLNEDYYARIKRELNVFRENGGIMREDFEKVKKLRSVQIFQIQNGKLMNQGDSAYHKFLRTIAYVLPDMEFVINMLDEPRIARSSRLREGMIELYSGDNARRFLNDTCPSRLMETHGSTHGFFTSTTSFSVLFDRRPLPLFSQATIEDCFLDITFPSHYFMTDSDSDDDMDVPWANKSDDRKLFWRGSTTGTVLSPQSQWSSTHRFKFMSFANSHKDLVDVGFTAIIQSRVADQDVISQFGPILSKVEFADHFKKKVLVRY
jgi:hypothetical protein